MGFACNGSKFIIDRAILSKEICNDSVPLNSLSINNNYNTFIIKKNDDFYYFKYRYLKGKDIYVYCFKCDQISGINKLVNSKELKYNGNTFS